MKNTKPILGGALLFAFLLASNYTATAQKIEYTYDSSGNRMKKELLFGSGGDDDLESELYRKRVEIQDVVSHGIVKIYPNPTEGLLKLEFSESLTENSSVRLVSISGEIILERRVTSTIIQLDFREQAKGNYILQLLNGEDISNWKIIKQ